MHLRSSWQYDSARRGSARPVPRSICRRTRPSGRVMRDDRGVDPPSCNGIAWGMTPRTRNRLGTGPDRPDLRLGSLDGPVFLDVEVDRIGPVPDLDGDARRL